MVEAVDVVDVDAIWTSLGRTGKYQIKQTLICLIAIWSCSAHVMSIVFIGYRPTYQCREVSVNVSMAADVKVTFAYDKCSVKRIVNDSGVASVTTEDCPNGWTYSEFGEYPRESSIISEWDLVCGRAELAELSQTLMMFGQGVGAFVFTGLSDRYGRKPMHIICHLVLFAIALGTAFVPSYAGFAVMRVLTGAFQQGAGLCLAILNLELFPKEIRGNAEVAGLLFWTTGVALVTPISYIFRNMSWRYLQICLAGLSSWSLIEWFVLEESLRWLIANGKVKRAKAVLKRACRENKKDYDEIAASSGFREYELRYGKERDGHDTKLELLPVSDDRQKVLNSNGGGDTMDGTMLVSVNKERKRGKMGTKNYTVMDLLKSKRLLLSSLIMWFAWITNSITYYGIMLISSSLAGDRFLNFFLGSIVEYPAAFVEYSIINRYGRKPAVIMFHSVCGASLIIATILTTTANGNHAMVLASTVFTLIGKFAITGSFSTIFLYTPELYPTNMRNVGIGMSSCASRIGGMVAPFARNLAEIALWAPGLIFGIMCAIVAILMFWVPETNQYELPQTIEETEQWYKDNQFKLPWKRDQRPFRDRTVVAEENNSD